MKKVINNMEKLVFEVPSIERKNDAIDYIQEFKEYGSEINGVGGLDKYIDNYEEWLNYLCECKNVIPNEKLVPGVTFFLVRKSDNRIVGMINIRLALNEKLKQLGGNIGYSIRPTERRKGYNKINLYLALLECQKHNIKEVLLDCDKSNVASSCTIKALGGKLIEEYYENKVYNTVVQKYIIDVDTAIKTYGDIYN